MCILESTQVSDMQMMSSIVYAVDNLKCGIIGKINLVSLSLNILGKNIEGQNDFELDNSYMEYFKKLGLH